MATDFMPRMPDQQQQQQAAYYHQTHQQMQMGAAAAAAAGVGNMYYGSGGGGIQQYPQISPHSTSPTSPSTKSYHSRQLRPLYTPAVLRPTEFPSKLPTRRQCQPAGGQAEGDGAGAGGNDQSGSSAAASIKSSGSFISLSGLSALSSRLTRRASAGCSKINKNDWNLDMFPQVTDAPKRTHWKPDPAAQICDDPACKRYFNYFTRRHHCRRCGNIFCDAHSSRSVPLDQDVNFNPRAPSLSRSCDHCFEEFRIWSSRTNSRASSSASSDQQAGSSSTVPSTPITASPTVVNGALATTKTQEVAASVPRDWNWSTF